MTTEKLSISVEMLRELLDYDPCTGVLTWRARPMSLSNCARAAKIWNTRYSGKPAFIRNNRGYKEGRIFNKPILAHRAIWAIHYGEWPRGDIDHIDGDPSNNKIENLRCVSHSENRKNSKRPSNNLSGVIGVTWNKEMAKWRAHIKVNGIQKHLGYFDVLENAKEARKLAERKFGYHENHGR